MCLSSLDGCWSICLTSFNECSVDLGFFSKTEFIAHVSEAIESVCSVELEVLLQFLETNWAECSYSACSLFFSTHKSVHETLIVDAMSKTKHMSDFVSHDVTSTHYEVLFAVRIVDTIEGWIISMEREGANTYIVGGPAEAEIPTLLRIQILIRETNHAVCIAWLIAWKRLK